MSRFVWPNAFQLFSAGWVSNAESSLKLLTKAVAESLILKSEMVDSSRKMRVATSVLTRVASDEEHQAVILRWSTSPVLGLPRQPFRLYRRLRDYKFETLVVTGLIVNGLANVDWGLREMYIVHFQARLSPGQTLTVVALDRTYQPIPEQSLTFKRSGDGQFTSPGIASLRVTGEGRLGAVEGVDQAVLANDPAWQMVQIVGLPFKSGEIGMPSYDPQPQGYVPASLNGFDAAKQRLQIESILHHPIPPTGIADFPTPLWPSADPELYLKYLRDGSLSAFWLVQKCLSNTDDNDPYRLQADYVEKVFTDGIRQADIPSANPGPDPTEMNLPAVALVLLSVSTNTDAATGLGYGTIDFPIIQGKATGDYLEPPGALHLSWDYMIATEFTIPFFGPYEIAALAQVRQPPESPNSLNINSIQVNRTPTQDSTYTESVRLKWNLSTNPQAYAVLVSYKTADSEVLNAKRPVAGGYDPYVPIRPASEDGHLPIGVETTFTNPVAPTPISGMLTSRYLVAGVDVFGRWSDWLMGSYNSPAPPVIQPGLHSASLIQDVSAAVGDIVPANLEIEFSWDWSDRTPDQIEFTGDFISPMTMSIPLTSSGFALSPIGAPSPSVLVSFQHPTGTPLITSGHPGKVETLTVDPPDADRRRYRLTIQGISCDYTIDDKVAYVVFARGAEHVRPSEYSDWVGPRRAEVFDPLPPAIPRLPIDLQWTALPDATGRARAVLSWPSSSGATGYVVWEATETALRAAVAPTAADPPLGTSLLDRATSLRSMLTSSAESQAISLQAFSRLNTDLIHDTQLELDLPSGSSTIYAYRVSSVNSNNVESERSSTIALFAVPHRNVPGQPRLVLRKTTPSMANPAGKLKVIAMPGLGQIPTGYRIYRVRSQTLLSDPGLKGPPKFAPSDSGWAPIIFQTLEGGDLGMALEDGVSSSWYPYYYQIVALGEDNPLLGEYAGESIPSVVQPGILPPPDFPLLSVVADTANATNRVITFRTDLPVKSTSLGIGLITLTQIDPASDGRRIVRKRQLSLRTSEILQATPLTLLSAPTQTQLVAMPEISRGEIDLSEQVLMTIRFRADVIHGTLSARDPLGRTTEVAF